MNLFDILKFMTTTPTPRTDANAVWPASNDDSDKPSSQGSHVDVDFARELERENARLRDALQKMYDAPSDCSCGASDETIAIWAEAWDILSNIQDR
jgi:hypothetical protein